jgi:TolB protein
MRHTPHTRRLLNIFLAALIVFPNLLFAPASASASPQRDDNSEIYLMNTEPTPTSTPMPGVNAEVQVTSEVQPYIVAPGGGIVFKSRVFNNGPDAASGVTFAQTIPSGLIVNSVQPSVGMCMWVSQIGGGATPSCGLGDMAAFGEAYITVHATVNLPNGAGLQAHAQVSSSSPDANRSNNVADAPAIVRAVTPAPTGKLVFVSRRDGNSEIYAAEANGTGITNLSNHAARDYEPAWSPDGQKIVFASARSGQMEVWMMRADGSNPTQLTSNSSDGLNFAWSPDGSKIAWQNYDGDNYDICLVNADGTGFINLTQDTAFQDRPVWSPDSTRIAFEDYGANTNANVHVVNANGTGRQNLTNDPDFPNANPAWSPDGQKIAFESARETGAGPGIYVMNADGSNPTNLSLNRNDGTPVWSPDGTQIAFWRFVNARYTLHMMNADGTGQIMLSDYTASAYYKPQWSPNSDALAFTAIAAGDLTNNVEVFSINENSSGLTNVSNLTGVDNDAKWQPPAPPPTPTPSPTPPPTPSPTPFETPQPTPTPPSPNTPSGANITVTANGVQLTFANVMQAGQTTVTRIDPNSLQGIPGEYVVNANSLAFEIRTTATYAGAINIGFQVPGVTNPITFSALRVLHGEPPPVPNFVDRTVLAPDSPTHNFAARTVYARVGSLSPFVIAERADGDGVAPDISVASPAADAVYLLRQIVGASYACADAGSGVASCIGTQANGAALDTGAVGSFNFAINARDNAGNASERTVNYRVAYGINPLFDQAKAYRSGSNIPIRLELTDAAHVNQSASNISVTALSVMRISDNAPGALADPVDATTDFNFRYAGGQYHFNLRTSGYATGTYLLSFKAGNDPTTHTVQFQVK